VRDVAYTIENGADGPRIVRQRVEIVGRDRKC